MRYYYAGPDRQPVGPVEIEDLRHLRRAESIQDGTWVLEEGATSWTTAASILAANPSPLPLSTSAPAQPLSPVAPSPREVSFPVALLCFLFFFPLGFALWGQFRKGLVWLILSFVTLGVAWAVSWVDYWMAWSAQRSRRLEPWDWFPSSRP
jgi:GYF domain 2